MGLRDARSLRRTAATHRRERLQPCWRCAGSIDYDARVPEPSAYTLGHRVPVSTAPELAHDEANLAPEHYLCNVTAGDRPTAGLGLRSRDW